MVKSISGHDMVEAVQTILTAMPIRGLSVVLTDLPEKYVVRRTKRDLWQIGKVDDDGWLTSGDALTIACRAVYGPSAITCNFCSL